MSRGGALMAGKFSSFRILNRVMCLRGLGELEADNITRGGPLDELTAGIKLLPYGIALGTRKHREPRLGALQVCPEPR